MTSVTLCAAAALVIAIADTRPAGAEAPGFPKEFKNLQVVGKKIAPDDLKKMMNGFTEQLGVKCTFATTSTTTRATNARRRRTRAR